MYKQELIEKVAVARQELINKYQDFMNTFVVPELAASEMNVAVISLDDLRDEDINPDKFGIWLKQEGLSYSKIGNHSYHLNLGE